MDCRDFQERQWDRLAEGLDAAQERALRLHQENCPSCAAAAADSERVWEFLDVVPAVETPGAVRESAFSSIQSLLEQDRKAVEEPAPSPARLFFAMLSGAALTALSLWSLNRQVGLQVFSTAGIAACAAWWTGLFALSIGMAASRFRYGRLRLGLVSSIGAGGAGILLIGTAFCPKLDLLALWQNSLLGGGLTASWGAEAGHLAFGVLYALLPTLGVSLYFGRRLRKDWILNALWVSVGFLLLMAPNLYAQCCFIPASLAGFLTAGIALGSLGGALGGLGTHRLRHALIA